MGCACGMCVEIRGRLSGEGSCLPILPRPPDCCLSQTSSPLSFWNFSGLCLPLLVGPPGLQMLVLLQLAFLWVLGIWTQACMGTVAQWATPQPQYSYVGKSFWVDMLVVKRNTTAEAMAASGWQVKRGWRGVGLLSAEFSGSITTWLVIRNTVDFSHSMKAILQ